MSPAKILVSVDEPYICVRFQGEVSDAEHETYLAALLNALKRRQPRATRSIILNDARAGFKGTPAQHQRQTAFTREHADLYRSRVVAVAFVVQDSFVKSVLSSVIKLNPGPVPAAVHLSIAEAKGWADSLARAS